MLRSLVVLFVLATTASAAAQEATTNKEQHVRELLTLMRAGDMGVQVIDGMIDGMKEAIPGAPEEFWKSFRQKVKASDLVDLLVPVYSKHLEDADVQELIRFYSTPTGRRFIEKQPLILQESMTVGQKWGEQIAAQAIQELQKAKPDQE